MNEAFDPAFEAALARGCDDATRATYADWLEARGAPARADALRRYRPAPPVPPLQFVFDVEPDEERPLWCWGPEPPLRILVIADFWGRPDPRPIEDRLGNVGKDPFSFLRRDEERSPGFVARDADPEARASWRSLRWLMDRVPPGTSVWPLNATPADLVEELQDSPSLLHSRVFMTVNDRNHPGMTPYFAVVVGFPLDRVADAYLLEKLAEIGRMKNLPIFVPTHEDFAAEAASTGDLSRDAPEARYLVFCAPEIVVARTATGAVLGQASFLLAACLARGWGRYGGAGDLRGELDAELSREVTPSQSILAWERGVLAFVGVGSKARLIDDATFGAHASPMSRSLSWLHLATRLALHALRVQPSPSPDPPDDLTAEGMAAAIERGLARHLRSMPGVSVALRGARFTEPPRLLAGRMLEFPGRLEVELVVTVALETTGSLTLREQLAMRLGP